MCAIVRGVGDKGLGVGFPAGLFFTLHYHNVALPRHPLFD